MLSSHSNQGIFMKFLFVMIIFASELCAGEQRYIITEAASQAFLIDSFTGKTWIFQKEEKNWNQTVFDYDENEFRTILRGCPEDKLEIIKHPKY